MGACTRPRAPPRRMGMFAPVLLAAVLIQDAFSCGKTGSAGGLAAGTDMVRYTINRERFPEAVCNDGSPAVFYFAPHTDPADRGKWIIFLQGGGGCQSGQDCAQRWCSIDTNFGMDKMTSTLTRPSIRIGGFLDPDPRNRFGSWNRVLIHYCSSDTWAGTKSVVTQGSAGGGPSREYTIHFKGSYIVDAVLDTLRSAGKRRVVRPSLEGPPWPDLDTATHVILAGSSAGAGGVRNNADRVGAKLRATNPGLEDYRAVADAMNVLDHSRLGWAGSTVCAADPAGCSFETYMQKAWEETEVAFRGARGDESCVAAHPGEEWRCAEGQHVLMHHLTTPFFVRADLQDQLVAGNFVEAGLGTYGEYGAALEGELRNLPLPEEPRGGVPGVFAPQCRHHEAFTDNQPVFQVRVDGINFHDLVWNWWRGAQPQQAIRPFAGPGAAPGCP